MKTITRLLHFSFIVFSIATLAGCKKNEDDQLNNLMMDRKDISQAQALTENTISSNTTLSDRVNGVDYIVTGKTEIDAALTIQPGVTIMFKEGAGFIIKAEGTLTAIGNTDSKILFTSETGNRGGWSGLTFLSNSSRNVLENCIVEHGGGANTYGQANIVVGNGGNHAMVAITNSEVRASAGKGILVSAGSKINHFTGNNIHTNSSVGLSVYVADAANLTEGNTFKNNGKEFIELHPEGDIINEPVVLKPLSIPYLLTGRMVAGNTFKIEPGTRINMESSAGLIIDGVNGHGLFEAVGTSASPITITGIYSQPGVWNAIQLNSTSVQNRIEYCNIHGGGAAEQGFMGGMVSITGNTSIATIRGNTISGSAGYGIYVASRSIQLNNDMNTGNSFADNAMGNIKIEGD